MGRGRWGERWRLFGPLGALIIGGGLVGAYPVYADGNGSPDECKTGVSVEGNEDSLTYTTNEGTIEFVCIKSGANMFTDGHSGQLGNGTHADGCYTISGVGTASVTVTRNGDGPNCQGLSHIDIGISETTETVPPQETETATPTEETPTASPTTPVATATGSATVTGTATPHEGKIQIHKYVWTGTHWQNQGAGQVTFRFDVSGSDGFSGVANHLHPFHVPFGTVTVSEQAVSGYTFVGFYIPEHGNAGCQTQSEEGPFEATAEVEVSGPGIVHICAYNRVAVTPTATVTGTPVPPQETPTATPTTPVATATGTATVTATPTTPVATATGTATVTATPTTPVATATGTATVTATPTTPTGTPTVTETPTQNTPTATPTTPVATATSPSTMTATPTEGTPVTNTPSATPTNGDNNAPSTNTPTQGQTGEQTAVSNSGLTQTTQGQQATPVAPSSGTGTAATGNDRAILALGILMMLFGGGTVFALRRER